MSLRKTLFLVFSSAFPLFAQDKEPSEYRIFTDKRDLQIEARILSIADDQKTMTLQRQDGNVFVTAITILSLEDQQFVKQWLNPSAPPLTMRLKGFGILSQGDEIDMSNLGDATDIIQFGAMRTGWIALTSSGDILSSNPRYHGMEEIHDFTSNTVWMAFTTEKGEYLNGGLKNPHDLDNVVSCANGAGHSVALLENGEVKVFGDRYETDEVISPPGELPPIVAIATVQGGVSAIDEAGTIHRWSPDWEEIKSHRPGDGIVEVQGSIFTFLGLTRSGEVYEWGGDPEKAKIPRPLEGKGPFIKVRCNGNTRAVQKEDETWIAWGTNGAGIVDRINSLPPTPDIAFFSEPNKLERGHLIYLEPES